MIVSSSFVLIGRWFQSVSLFLLDDGFECFDLIGRCLSCLCGVCLQRTADPYAKEAGDGGGGGHGGDEEDPQGQRQC